ncbi:hypothetical protein X758_11865 [Mesorhizobium sp. LSHC416B00]|nr:hypothetical protein X761_12535 [Mesorhizobium sp. LSHC424B00]ESX73084.1 hypothetical protein X758_11865 [Mesorhizobium sp. LSHC416B00]
MMACRQEVATFVYVRDDPAKGRMPISVDDDRRNFQCPKLKLFG